MNTALRLLFAAGILAAPMMTARAAIERVVEKSFPVGGAGTLHVEAQGGEIRVNPSSDSVVTVTARQKIRANSEAEADALLTKLELTMEQTGNDVRIVSKYERQPLGFRWGSWPPVQVNFVISVPAAFATDLLTSGGGIVLGNLDGKVSARTSGGGIRMGRMGSTVDARTSGGSITLDQAGGRADLRTSGGNISVGRVNGPADLSTSGGGIRADSVSGALRAHTSGGSIQAGITGPLTDDCSLSTSGGSVRVTVDPSVAFRLDASTSGGSVEAEGLTIKLEKSRTKQNQLAGLVNGGGPALKLRSSGGSIAVRPR